VNWIDILLVLVIGFSVLSGFTAGFARVGVGFIATILGIFLGFWCYGIAGSYVLDYVSTRAIANLIGFFVIFIGVVLIGAVIGQLLAKALQMDRPDVVGSSAGWSFRIHSGRLHRGGDGDGFARVRAFASAALSPGFEADAVHAGGVSHPGCSYSARSEGRF
jgi:hypothetical protein